MTGTDPAAVEPEIDPLAALAAFGVTDASEPRRVKGGWDTLLWRFATSDGKDHSLRVFVLANRNDAFRRERLALGACEEAGLPAPRIEHAGEVSGLPAMVLSWCPGRPVLSAIEKKPWLVWRLGRMFGRAQAQVHAVAPPEEFVAAAPRDWVSRLGAEYEALAAHVLSLGLGVSSLIHMDFHPLNVVSDGAAVTGILDWSGAAAGDPRADLARTEVTLLAAPIPPGPTRPLLELARTVILRAWRSGYRQQAGALPDYRPLRAWAAATLVAEWARVLDHPNVWGTREDLDRFRHRLDGWASEAGASV